MSIPTLYNMQLSGNCYKVRLFAAMAGIPLEVQEVNLTRGEHKEGWFTALNPWQKVPVLVHDNQTIWDSQAILVYLAEKFQKEAWLSADPLGRGRVAQWLSVAVNEVQHGPADAQKIKLFGVDLRYDDAVKASAYTLPILDQFLAEHIFLAADHPTIADCAVYPYIRLAPEGGIDIEGFSSIQRWMRDIEALTGYIPIDG